MAMVQNHYEINVSQNGEHCFATAERSCTTAEGAAQVLADLLERFPASEGYKVTCTQITCYARDMTLAGLEKYL